MEEQKAHITSLDGELVSPSDAYVEKLLKFDFGPALEGLPTAITAALLSSGSIQDLAITRAAAVLGQIKNAIPTLKKDDPNKMELFNRYQEILPWINAYRYFTKNPDEFTFLGKVTEPKKLCTEFMLCTELSGSALTDYLVSRELRSLEELKDNKAIFSRLKHYSDLCSITGAGEGLEQSMYAVLNLCCAYRLYISQSDATKKENALPFIELCNENLSHLGNNKEDIFIQLFRVLTLTLLTQCMICADVPLSEIMVSMISCLSEKEKMMKLLQNKTLLPWVDTVVEIQVSCIRQIQQHGNFSSLDDTTKCFLDRAAVNNEALAVKKKKKKKKKKKGGESEQAPKPSAPSVPDNENGVKRGDLIEKNCPEKVKEVLSLFGKSYIVGGALRDVALGKKPKDWDLSIIASRDEILRVLKSSSETLGISALDITQEGHFLYTIFFADAPDVIIEITPLEKPAELSEDEFIQQIQEKLDYDVNSMFYDPRHKCLRDPYKVFERLLSGSNLEINCIDYTATIAIRGALLLHKRPELKATQKLLDKFSSAETKTLLETPGAKKTFVKLLYSENAYDALLALNKQGFLAYLFPEVIPVLENNEFKVWVDDFSRTKSAAFRERAKNEFDAVHYEVLGAYTAVVKPYAKAAAREEFERRAAGLLPLRAKLSEKSPNIIDNVLGTARTKVLEAETRAKAFREKLGARGFAFRLPSDSPITSSTNQVVPSSEPVPPRAPSPGDMGSGK